MEKKLLIIDDEDVIRKFFAFGFSKCGYKVFEAATGLDGLAIAEAEVPDVIILDIMMPGMHGFEVCKRLRANPLFDQTVVIIASAKAYKPDIDKALELGADAYRIKPVGTDELCTLAGELLPRRRGGR